MERASPGFRTTGANEGDTTNTEIEQYHIQYHNNISLYLQKYN